MKLDKYERCQHWKNWRQRREEIRKHPEAAKTEEIARLFEESRWLRDELQAVDFASVEDFGVLAEIAKESRQECKRAMKGLKGAAGEVNYFGLVCKLSKVRGRRVSRMVQREDDRASYVSEQLHQAILALENIYLTLERVRLLCRKVSANSRETMGD